MICLRALVLAGLLTTLPGILVAADLSVPAPVAPRDDDSFIWGAIAFSPATGKHGMFWGGETRKAALESALRHCENAGGSACRIVAQFQNVRHERNRRRFSPVHQCAALAVAQPASSQRLWAAQAGISRADAEQRAMARCGPEGSCQIQEWVCT